MAPCAPTRPMSRNTRWRGALLQRNSEVRIEVLESEKRPVSAVADSTEVRDVLAIEIHEDVSVEIPLLFEAGNSLSDRILSEQFEL